MAAAGVEDVDATAKPEFRTQLVHGSVTIPQALDASYSADAHQPCDFTTGEHEMSDGSKWILHPGQKITTG